MKITLLPSGVPADAVQYLTSYLVNEAIAIDAGCLGFYKTPREQAAVRHVFLSHTHIDHLASLPIFLENVAGAHPTPVTIHASEAVEECLRRDFFNGRVWPNFLDLADNGVRFATLSRLENGRPVQVEGVRVTPIAVDHTVPTLGFIIEDQDAAIVISSDTAPTEAIWSAAKKTPNLRAVFLEVTFANAFTGLATLTKHLTPEQFVAEMAKLAQPVPFYAIHLRARMRDLVENELMGYRLPNVQIAQFGKKYEF